MSLNAGSNPLPAGLTLNPAGVLSGTPTADETKPITIKVTDSTGASKTKEFTLAITEVPPASTFITYDHDHGASWWPRRYSLQRSVGLDRRNRYQVLEHQRWHLASGIDAGSVNGCD